MRQAVQKQHRISRSSQAKVYRFDARLTANDKKIIQHAADLAGRSMTDFVLESAKDAARRTIEDRKALMLTVRESEDFVKALLNPPEPGPVLRKAVREYRKVMSFE
jgi:uncharacterized protein (DUF1778 family)